MITDIDPSDEAFIKKRFFTLRLMCVAMWVGMFLFLAISIFSRHTGRIQPDLSAAAPLEIIAAIFTALAFIACLVLRLMTARFLARAESLNQACQTYFSFTLIAFALPEGTGFFCLVAALIGTDPTLMHTLFAVVVLAQLIHFPSRRRFTDTYQQARALYLASQRRT